jgi:WXG100 family type VII secretion target
VIGGCANPQLRITTVKQPGTTQEQVEKQGASNMATRFMTDPHGMRAMAGRFETHAQTVEDEARRMWASSQNIAGAGWSGLASATSLDTMGQMNTAFRNIVNMLHGVRDGLIRDANNYEQQEQASQQILGS